MPKPPNLSKDIIHIWQEKVKVQAKERDKMARAKNPEFDKIKYQNEFNKANYDRQEVVMPKGKKAVIKEAAKAAGQSVSEYINQAINERMTRDN